ncbi:ParB-like nuclease family protein [Saccharopolyspora erythraea NRRL 2338]|nr:ParB/RepB/Spo0J family partition protein [Saccharopolyspora erythraea]PFG97844.1 ParB-like nuclease family protein [Saccharopolyspora erythraea NRRL 2338]QRK87984.1 ParB-like nuclease domain-containing protein [Saccharopolyspora erythraea]
MTHEGSHEETTPEPTEWQPIRSDDLPIVTLSINSLLIDGSPRRAGADDEHIRLLAESEERLPPIIVHGRSGRVIDGVHRVHAATLRGEDKIEARVYEGTDGDAFLLAVQMNIAHGLPLTRADRTTAAARIIQLYPHWSNRRIATVTGLSAGTVGKLRWRSNSHDARSPTRVGKDGRVRPANGSAARRQVAKLLTENPTASIRAIANEAGVSHSTVHGVRQRVRAGQDPALRQQEAPESLTTPQPPEICAPQETIETPGPACGSDVAAILENLKADPSLRFKEAGRFLLRWLDQNRVEMTAPKRIAEMVPDHCAASVAKLARGYARAWSEFAAQLEER